MKQKVWAVHAKEISRNQTKDVRGKGRDLEITYIYQQLGNSWVPFIEIENLEESLFKEHVNSMICIYSRIL